MSFDYIHYLLQSFFQPYSNDMSVSHLTPEAVEYIRRTYPDNIIPSDRVHEMFNSYDFKPFANLLSPESAFKASILSRLLIRERILLEDKEGSFFYLSTPKVQDETVVERPKITTYIRAENNVDTGIVCKLPEIEMNDDKKEKEKEQDTREHLDPVEMPVEYGTNDSEDEELFATDELLDEDYVTMYRKATRSTSNLVNQIEHMNHYYIRNIKRVYKLGLLRGAQQAQENRMNKDE
jgi:hypothetical protein